MVQHQNTPKPRKTLEVVFISVFKLTANWEAVPEELSLTWELSMTTRDVLQMFPDGGDGGPATWGT